ncbi:MAG: nucleoside diphosphate kinase regulator [Syntrophobacter sp.]
MRNKRKLYISEYDMKRLKTLIDLLQENQSDDRERMHVEFLDEVLRDAEVVTPEMIPRDVVTMNSKIRVRNQDTGSETVYHLVFPGEADVRKNRISVLAPVGGALIGCRAGSSVKLRVPAGETRLIIEEIQYQPESAGDYHL